MTAGADRRSRSRRGRATWRVERRRAASGGPTPDAVAAADLNYDFRTDLALAGPAGLCLLRQDAAGQFTDVTPASKLPAALLRAPAFGVWPADIDTDGDLDLVLAPRDGHPIVLRNNGDGTFTPRDLFPVVTRARGFAWADLDGEGVPDAAFLDEAGAVQVFLNLRGGHSARRRCRRHRGPAVAIAAAEASGDAMFDLLVLARDGTIAPALARRATARGSATDVSRASIRPPGLEPGAARLLTADLDNNGADGSDRRAARRARGCCSARPAARTRR